MRNRTRGAREKKKVWLLRYREIITEIEREAEQAAYWKDKAACLSTPTLNNYGISSANRKGMADYVARFLDLAKECSELGRVAEEQKRLIITTIDKVDDQDCRELLKYLYIDGYDFIQISTKMCYSVDWLWHLHGKALDLLVIPVEKDYE